MSLGFDVVRAVEILGKVILVLAAVSWTVSLLFLAGVVVWARRRDRERARALDRELRALLSDHETGDRA